MICPNCGTQLKEDAQFCAKCGTEYKSSPLIQILIKEKNREKVYFNKKIEKLTNDLLRLNVIAQQLRTYNIKKINGRTSIYNVNFKKGFVTVDGNDLYGVDMDISLDNKNILRTDGHHGSNQANVTRADYPYPYKSFDVACEHLKDFFNWFLYNRT